MDMISLGSVGGALALLDSIYLPLHLPSHISFRTITYGMPRVSKLHVLSVLLVEPAERLRLETERSLIMSMLISI